MTPISVRVDPRLCEGHGLCLQLAPGVFDLDDNETAFCAVEPDADQLDEVKAAVAACPRQAITVEVPRHLLPEDTR